MIAMIMMEIGIISKEINKMTIIAEPIPGYGITTKSEVVVTESGITISRVLKSKIYKLEVETDSISKLKKLVEIDDESSQTLAACFLNLEPN